MTVFLIVVHIIVSLLLMLVVLIQQGKGADLAGAFGGGGSQTVFGARGATTLLHKLTVIFFIMFVLTSMTLSVLQTRPEASVIGDEPVQTAPATTGESAPADQAPPASEPTSTAVEEPSPPTEQ